MITKTEKKLIVATLGKQYSGKVIEHLDKRKIYNAKGGSFSAPSIRMIVSGTENLKVESEILKLVAKEKSRIEREKVKRRNIVKR